jgi:hypothetical protein
MSKSEATNPAISKQQFNGSHEAVNATSPNQAWTPPKSSPRPFLQSWTAPSK